MLRWCMMWSDMVYGDGLCGCMACAVVACCVVLWCCGLGWIVLAYIGWDWVWRGCAGFDPVGLC